MFGMSRERRDDQYQAQMRLLYQQRIRPTYAGVAASYSDMLTVPPVWKSLHLTAGIISVMPIDAYRDRNDERTELPSLPRLLREPSAVVSLEDWVFQCVESMIMHGDLIGRIVARDNRFVPTQIEIVDPAVVTVKHGPNGIEWFFDRVRVPTDDVWHVQGRPKLGSPFGLGLIEFMVQTVGVSLAARKYEAQWFGDGAHPTTVVTPATDPGPEGAEGLKQRLMGITRGNREPLIVPAGTTIEPFQETPVNSQLLEALRANATDVAHFFGIPPEFVGGTSGDSMTYSNVESRILDLLAFGVQYWMVKLEKALSRLLPQPVFVKFKEAAVTRTDIKTKVDTLVAQVGGGIMTQNEARKPLDLPAMPGGDVLFEPKKAQAPAGSGI